MLGTILFDPLLPMQTLVSNRRAGLTPGRRSTLAACLAVALVACGGGESLPTPAPPAPPAASPAPSPAPSPSPSPAPSGPQALHVQAEGSGRVSTASGAFDCASDCSQSFDAGAQLALSAQPTANQVFVGWSGDCSGTGTCVLTMSQPRSVSARFVALAGGAACVIERGGSAPPVVAAGHPRILLNHASTRACLVGMLAGNHEAAQRFKEWVDNALNGGDAYGFEPWHAALLYQTTGQAHYAAAAVQRTEAFVAAEEALIASGARPAAAYDSYLEVGGLVGGLALVYDWCFDHLLASQRQRWLAYANQAVSNVWNPDTASWGGRLTPWSGWSIDNPSNNYYYSFLRATMLLGLASSGENAQAAGWLNRFRNDKIAAQLVPTFNAELAGGGSREGTGYGTAMKNLWQLYDWWERSTGERIATLGGHSLASLPHFVHNVVPTLDRIAPTGDHARDSSAALFDYHREYLLGLINLFPQERAAGAAADLLAQSTQPRMTYGFERVFDFINAVPRLPATRLDELATTYWGAGTGQLLMRSDWSRDAAWANFICGPYTESHAHRDQGSFVLYRGAWLAWDANIASLSGIEQDEEMHNLVRIESGGRTVRQEGGANGCKLLALADQALFTYALADVTPVYDGHAAVAKVEREFLFIRPATFVVFDRVQSAPGTRRVWMLNLPEAPQFSGAGFSLVQGGSRLDVHRLAPSGATAQWVGGARVEVAQSTGTESLFLHVLGTNGAVSAAQRNDQPGQTGTEFTLADGRRVLLRFDNVARGGTLELRSAGGGLLFQGPLPTTVVAPPVFTH